MGIVDIKLQKGKELGEGQKGVYLSIEMGSHSHTTNISWDLSKIEAQERFQMSLTSGREIAILQIVLIDQVEGERVIDQFNIWVEELLYSLVDQKKHYK